MFCNTVTTEYITFNLKLKEFANLKGKKKYTFSSQCQHFAHTFN